MQSLCWKQGRVDMTQAGKWGWGQLSAWHGKDGVKPRTGVDFLPCRGSPWHPVALPGGRAGAKGALADGRAVLALDAHLQLLPCWWPWKP